MTAEDAINEGLEVARRTAYDGGDYDVARDVLATLSKHGYHLLKIEKVTVTFGDDAPVWDRGDILHKWLCYFNGRTEYASYTERSSRSMGPAYSQHLRIEMRKRIFRELGEKVMNYLSPEEDVNPGRTGE